MVLYDVLRLTGPPSTPVQRLVVHGKDEITQVLIKHLYQAYPTAGALLSQPTESCEVGVLKVGSQSYHG